MQHVRGKNIPKALISAYPDIGLNQKRFCDSTTYPILPSNLKYQFSLQPTLHQHAETWSPHEWAVWFHWYMVCFPIGSMNLKVSYLSLKNKSLLCSYWCCYNLVCPFFSFFSCISFVYSSPLTSALVQRQCDGRECPYSYWRVLEMNTEFYTLWNYRRLILEKWAKEKYEIQLFQIYFM